MTYSIFYLSTRIGLLSSKSQHVNLFNFNLIYIYLIFYLFESLSDLFAKSDYSGDKYRFIFPGLQGLLTGWILEKNSITMQLYLMELFFLICCFISIHITERLIVKLILIFKKHGFDFIKFSEYTKPILFDRENAIKQLKESWNNEKRMVIAMTVILAAFPFVGFLFWKFIFFIKKLFLSIVSIFLSKI